MGEKEKSVVRVRKIYHACTCQELFFWIHTYIIPSPRARSVEVQPDVSVDCSPDPSSEVELAPDMSRTKSCIAMLNGAAISPLEG